jgi:enoyl-[acyl-carrier protein] reductase I
MKQQNQYFSNSWAVILGGSSGMGLAAAKKLASEGMHLCLVHRDRKAGVQQLQKEITAMKSHGIKVCHFNIDALRPEKRQEVIEQLKANMAPGESVKLLLHAIARGNLKPLAPHKSITEQLDTTSLLAKELDEIYEAQQSLLQNSDFVATLEAMALSLYDWVHDIFQQRLFAADSRVIGLTSEGGSKAWKTYGAVSVAKAALEALVRSIALEFAPYGIRCNALQPGVTDTPSLRKIPGSPQLKRAARERNPFHQLTTPETVADVIYLLCREEARWINGVVLPVDGGESIT